MIEAAHHLGWGTGLQPGYVIEDGLIDPRTLLRDTVVPTPFSRCAPGYRGLYDQCGYASRTTDHQHDVIDPVEERHCRAASAQPATADEEGPGGRSEAEDVALQHPLAPRQRWKATVVGDHHLPQCKAPTQPHVACPPAAPTGPVYEASPSATRAPGLIPAGMRARLVGARAPRPSRSCWITSPGDRWSGGRRGARP